MTIGIGDRLGRYQVLEQLPAATDLGRDHPPHTEGGLARPVDIAVYKALDPDSDQQVAIRVYPEQISRNPEVLAELRDRLREVAQLNHPNIPSVLGSGMHGRQPFVVFPFLAAGSLQDRIATGLAWTLDLDNMVGQMAAALSHAHRRGLLHGDLKPSKVLFDENGVVQLTGIGEAQGLQRAVSARWQHPVPAGSYRAPEAATLATSADQYSLGVILLELFTGRPPEEALALLHAEQDVGATRPAHPGPTELPPALWDVLRRATAAAPRERFADLQHMHLALRVALGLETATQRPVDKPAVPNAGKAPKRQGRLRPIWLAALLTLLCAVVTVPAFSAQREGWQLKDLAERLWSAPATPQPTVSRPAPSLNAEEPTATPTGSDGVGAPPAKPGLQQPSAAGLASTPSTEVRDPSAGGPASPTAEPPPAAAQPTSTPVLLPTATVLPTSTVVPSATPLPTDTPPPPPTSGPTEPAPEPTKKPGKCKDDPSHPNYCTPTP